MTNLRTEACAGLTGELIDVYGRLTDIRAAWESLLKDAEAATPFLTPQWVCAWWDVFGADHKLAVVAVWDEVLLVGLSLLMRTRGVHARLPAMLLQFIGTPLADRADVLARPGLLDPVMGTTLDTLAHAQFRWDVWSLREVPSYSATRAALAQQAAAHGWRVHETECALVPVMSVDAPHETLRTGFGSNIKKQTNNKRNRLKKRGTLTFTRQVITPDELEASLDTIMRIERTSWKGESGLGIFETEPQQRFFATALCAMADARMVDVAFLRVDDAAVAYHLGFRWNGRYYSYNLAFDPAWGDCSPGTVLMDFLIQDSADQTDLRVLDASRSVREHPHIISRWSGDSHTHVELTVYPRTLYARSLHVIHTHVGPRVRAFHAARAARAEPDE